jgi:hypothetical protein
MEEIRLALDAAVLDMEDILRIPVFLACIADRM